MCVCVCMHVGVCVCVCVCIVIYLCLIVYNSTLQSQLLVSGNQLDKTFISGLSKCGITPDGEKFANIAVVKVMRT